MMEWEILVGGGETKQNRNRIASRSLRKVALRLWLVGREWRGGPGTDGQNDWKNISIVRPK